VSEQPGENGTGRVDEAALRREAEERLRVAWTTDGEAAEGRGLETLRERVRVHADHPEARLWADLTGASAALAGEVAAILGLHPLVVEDIVEKNQRPKVELVESEIHLVAFALAEEGAPEEAHAAASGVRVVSTPIGSGFPGEVTAHEIDFVIGSGYLLTAHDDAWDPRATHHLRRGPGPFLAKGSDYLLWALVDAVVDGYFPVIDRIGDAIDALEDELIRAPTPRTLERLFELKRRLVEIRHVLAPSREIFNQMTNRELELVAEEHVIYFRDVYDHLIRLTDELDSFRDLVSSALDVYLSTVNNNLSLVMKRLTGVTVILAGVGAVAGLFGMSEAPAALAGSEGGGFWLVILGTAALATVALVVLRKIDWI
jgi:magnesium transporter